MTIPQHSSRTNEHYTPKLIVEPARALLGGFDLDPASCAKANKTIRATRYFTRRDDGLARQWDGAVFLNPPGGLLRFVGGRWRPVPKNAAGHYLGPGKSSMQVWWNRLVAAWMGGEVTQAFFVAFTLEILRTSQASPLPVQAFPRCYPGARLRFGGEQPTHGNVLVYLPPKGDSAQHAVDLLDSQFGPIGLCEPAGVVRWPRKER